MMKETKENLEGLKREQFGKILREELVMPVYQPILSLKDGEILGYEALSRITLKDSLLNPEEFFHMADSEDCLWRTEELCRRKSLCGAAGKADGIKLFLNVDPKVMKDPQFKEGVTCRYLGEYGIRSEDIVFEITERNSINVQEAFRDVICEKSQIRLIAEGIETEEEMKTLT